MVPLAPPRFSTIACMPRSSPSFCAIRRASVSAVPRGVNATMKRTGLPSCAGAASGRQTKKTNKAKRRSTRGSLRCEAPPAGGHSLLVHCGRGLFNARDHGEVAAAPAGDRDPHAGAPIGDRHSSVAARHTEEGAPDEQRGEEALQCDDRGIHLVPPEGSRGTLPYPNVVCNTLRETATLRAARALPARWAATRSRSDGCARGAGTRSPASSRTPRR